MKYFIKTNLTTMFRNWATYLPTILFLTAGLTILFSILCGVFSFYDDLRDRKVNVSGLDINIVHHWQLYHLRPPREEFTQAFGLNPAQKGRFIPDENAVIMPSDFLLINERLGDKVSFKVSLKKTLHHKMADEPYQVIQMAFLSDDYFTPFKDQINGDFIMGSRRLLEYIAVASASDGTRSGLQQFPFIFDSERGLFTDLDGNGEIRILDFESIGNLNDFDLFPMINEMFGGQALETRWDEYLFIPFKYYFDVYWPGDNDIITLRASAEDFNDIYELILLLNTNHAGNVTYAFDETSAMFFQGVREQTEMIAVVIPITVLLMLVVGMNFMGLQLMSVRRRWKDFAIQMMCGARQKHTVGGAVLHVLLATTVAVCLSVIFGALLVRYLDIRLYNVFVTVKWISILPVLGFGWLIGVLSCIPTLVRLSRITPVAILSEQ